MAFSWKTMADQDGDPLWIFVFGMLTVDALWTAYLEYRNVHEVNKSLTAPPVLNLSKDEFSDMSTRVSQQSSHKLVTVMAQFWIQALQFHSNYYPYVWQLSEHFHSNMTARAMWFAAVDVLMTTFLLVVAQRPHPPSAVSLIAPAVVGAPAFALYALLRIKVFEMLGPNGMYLVLNIFGIVAVVPTLVIISPMKYEYSALVDDDLGRALKALAVQVGYPPDRIFIYETDHCPNASYENVIFSKRICIYRSLTSIMDVPEVVGIFAHELGHWKYCHHLLNYLTLLISEVGFYFLHTVPYGNSRILRVFKLSDAHPVLGDLLALQFIGLPSMKMFVGVTNLLKAHQETSADDYACRLWDPKIYGMGQLKMYSYCKHPPSDGLHSAWYTGYPSEVQRLRRIESHIPP